MLLFIALLNLVCFLLPALISARVTSREDPVNLAAHHIRSLSTPLKIWPHKRDAALTAGTANIASTNGGGEVEKIDFDEEIDIPGLGRVVYLHVCWISSELSKATFAVALIMMVQVEGLITQDFSASVVFWVHYQSDQRAGGYYGSLITGIDMPISANVKVMDGEARLYVFASGQWDILVFDAYVSVHLPQGSKAIPPFKKEIKRWRAGSLRTVQGVPDNSGVTDVE